MLEWTQDDSIFKSRLEAAKKAVRCGGRYPRHHGVSECYGNAGFGCDRSAAALPGLLWLDAGGSAAAPRQLRTGTRRSDLGSQHVCTDGHNRNAAGDRWTDGTHWSIGTYWSDGTHWPNGIHWFNRLHRLVVSGRGGGTIHRPTMFQVAENSDRRNRPQPPFRIWPKRPL